MLGTITKWGGSVWRQCMARCMASPVGHTPGLLRLPARWDFNWIHCSLGWKQYVLSRDPQTLAATLTGCHLLRADDPLLLHVLLCQPDHGRLHAHLHAARAGTPIPYTFCRAHSHCLSRVTMAVCRPADEQLCARQDLDRRSQSRGALLMGCFDGLGAGVGWGCEKTQ